MTSMGIATIRYTEDDSTNKGKYDKAKVKRYWAGSQPHWNKEQQEQQQASTPAEEEYQEPVILKQSQQYANNVANAFNQNEPVIVKKNEDPRIKRLQQEEIDFQPTRVRQRIRNNQQFQGELREQDQNDNKEDPEEAARSRDLIKQRALMQERLQEQARQAKQYDREDGEDTDNEETDSEEEESSYLDDSEVEPEDNENFTSKIKPVFRRKDERQTRPQGNDVNEDEEDEDPKIKEQRKREQSHTIMRQIQDQENEAARIDNENKQQFEPEDVVTDNDEDADQEFEAWKLRELNRIKLERMDVNKEMQEKTDKDAASQIKKPKKRWTFLQKYYHKGAFFQEEPDDIRGTTNRDNIYSRDYSAPTGEDAMDKSKLPQVMQVRNFGRSGRTKWTHLVSEDTTAWDSPWVNREVYDKIYKKLAGSKAETDMPRKKAKQEFGYTVR